MILNLILASLALLSLALTLWQWVVARRFPLHRRVPAPASPPDPRRSQREEALRSSAARSTLHAQPPLTLLKPLRGVDSSTEACLRSWFTQQYSGPIQILFGVAAPNDPVCGTVRKLMREFPGRKVQLVVGPPPPGANAKVAKLVELKRLARHDLLVISDADVLVPPDFLANIVAPLCEVHQSQPREDGSDGMFPARVAADGSRRYLQGRENAPTAVGGYARLTEQTCGLVCCFYRLANPTTLAMQWEAIAINADFWSQVLQSRSLKPIDFALGAAMATRRRQLEEIGGFAPLVNCLADDYQLGNRIARRGHPIVLSPVVVECWSAPMGWAAVWKHQLRWARTIRVCQPAPYFFSLVSNTTLWPLLWLMVKPGAASLAGALFCVLVRVLTAVDLQRRLNQNARPPGPQPSSQAPWRYAWLIPVKDLLQVALWVLAFLGNRVEWRGQRMRLRPDGTLAPLNQPAR